MTPNTYTVTNTGTAGSGSGTSGDLVYCINQANANSGADMIVFSTTTAGGATDFTSGQHTIDLYGNLSSITGDVTITGPGANLLTVQRDGASPYAFSVFNVGDSTNAPAVTLSGTTITGGYTNGVGGGISVYKGSLTLADSVVTGNTAVNAGGQPGPGVGAGGGIGVYAGGSLTIEQSTVSGNVAAWSGGGVYFAGGSTTTGGTLTIENSTISGNGGYGYNVFNSVVTHSAGGGVYVDNIVGSGGVIVSNSTVADNYSYLGGGLAFRRFTGPSMAGTVLVENSTVTANSAAEVYENPYEQGGGGGFDFVSGTATISLQSSIVAGNFCTGYILQDLAALSSATPYITANYCLIGAADSVTLTSSSGNNLTGTEASPLEAYLGPLADNGGPTETCARNAKPCFSPELTRVRP